MGVIAATSMAGLGVRTLTETTLTSSDTLAYDSTKAGSTASSAIPVSGYGNVSAAAGLAVGSIAAGAARVIPLDTIQKYLQGTITITGGTGLVAAFLQ